MLSFSVEWDCLTYLTKWGQFRPQTASNNHNTERFSGFSVSHMATEHLRALASAAANAPAGSPSAAAAYHALGEALEPHSVQHSRAALAASIRSMHEPPALGHDFAALSATNIPAEEARAARISRIGLAHGTWERSQAIHYFNHLHAMQRPVQCRSAPLLVVPIWPCCEGLASVAHTIASALAQGAHTGATVLPFLAGCSGQSSGDTSCDLHASSDALLHGLLPLTPCNLSTALDSLELATLTEAVDALRLPPHARPGRGISSVVLLPPGAARLRSMGEARARCGLMLLANEHFANAAALVAPERLDLLRWEVSGLNMSSSRRQKVPSVLGKPKEEAEEEESTRRSQRAGDEATRSVIWMSSLLSFVLTPHPDLWASRLWPMVNGMIGMSRAQPSRRLDSSLATLIRSSAHGSSACRSACRMRGVTVAVHVRHGDKAHEPWKAVLLFCMRFKLIRLSNEPSHFSVCGPSVLTPRTIWTGTLIARSLGTLCAPTCAAPPMYSNRPLGGRRRLALQALQGMQMVEATEATIETEGKA